MTTTTRAAAAASPRPPSPPRSRERTGRFRNGASGRRRSRPRATSAVAAAPVLMGERLRTGTSGRRTFETRAARTFRRTDLKHASEEFGLWLCVCFSPCACAHGDGRRLRMVQRRAARCGVAFVYVCARGGGGVARARALCCCQGARFSVAPLSGLSREIASDGYLPTVLLRYTDSYVCVYIHTHTHTHIYIHIYIYSQPSPSPPLSHSDDGARHAGPSRAKSRTSPSGLLFASLFRAWLACGCIKCHSPMSRRLLSLFTPR